MRHPAAAGRGSTVTLSCPLSHAFFLMHGGSSIQRPVAQAGARVCPGDPPHLPRTGSSSLSSFPSLSLCPVLAPARRRGKWK